MGKKWAVVHEYDLDKGLCFLSRKDAGQGEVALFDSKEVAEEWVNAGEDIDADLWDINFIVISE